MNFCRRCGVALTQVFPAGYRCAGGHSIFLNPAPGVGLFLFDENGDLLLSIRAIDPDKGALDAFGGFVNGNETLEQALERELEEELALSQDNYSKPIYLTSMTSSYRYGGEDCPVLSSLYYAHLKPGTVLTPRDDVASVYRGRIEDIDLAQVGGNDVRNGLKVLRESLSAGLIGQPTWNPIDE